MCLLHLNCKALVTQGPKPFRSDIKKPVQIIPARTGCTSAHVQPYSVHNARATLGAQGSVLWRQSSQADLMCVIFIVWRWAGFVWLVTFSDYKAGCGQCGSCFRWSSWCCHEYGHPDGYWPPPGWRSVRKGPSTTWTRGLDTTTSSQGSHTLENTRWG